MCVRSIAWGGQWEGVEARGGAHLSPGTFPDPSHALLPTHISYKKVTRFCLTHHHLWTLSYRYIVLCFERRISSILRSPPPLFDEINI